MGSKTTLIVWVGISLGTVVACSISACGLPFECTFPLYDDGPCCSQPAYYNAPCCPGYEEIAGVCLGLGGSDSSGGGGGGEEPVEVDGALMTGAIFCSECAKSPFCVDYSGDAPVYTYLNDPDDLCPPPAMGSGIQTPAQPATRRTNDGDDETFYCLPVTGGDNFNVQEPGGWCIAPSLLEHAFVDKCGADAAEEETCVGSECENGDCTPQHVDLLTLCGKDETTVGTPDHPHASMWVAWDKIVDQVEGTGWNEFGEVPGYLNADPSNPNEPPPARYCFVTCFDHELFLAPTSCDPADDPWVSATSTFVSIGAGSEATVTVGTTTSSVDIEGIMAIDIPRDCREGGETASCNVNIGSARLKGSSDLVVQGFTISNLSLINRVNWTATASAYGGTTTVTLDSAPALITATVGPFGGGGMMRQELGGRWAEIDWNARTYQSTASFRSPLLNGDDTVLTLSGTIANIPPRAYAPSDQSFECTGDGRASVTLTAEGTDADGNSDLAGFVWSRELDGNWVVSSGPTLATRFQLGESHVILTAIDSARAKDMDGMKVTVVDSLAPDFSGIDVLPGSLWPANGRLHLFRLGQEISPTVTDTCDSSPSVRIVEASGNGDITYGDEAICIRAAPLGSPNPLRRFVVTVEAIDASGNWTQEDVLITNSDLAPAVADNDPRCP